MLGCVTKLLFFLPPFLSRRRSVSEILMEFFFVMFMSEKSKVFAGWRLKAGFSWKICIKSCYANLWDIYSLLVNKNWLFHFVTISCRKILFCMLIIRPSIHTSFSLKPVRTSYPSFRLSDRFSKVSNVLCTYVCCFRKPFKILEDIKESPNFFCHQLVFFSF